MPPADKSKLKNTLPQPELNPLVNPVLGAHMGRWAEVYFTSAPEKREEAVLELLRELEGDTSTSKVTPAAAPKPDSAGHLEARQAVVAREDPKPAAPAEESETSSIGSVTCRSCGKINPAQHKFCGMCGADLHPVRSHDSPIIDREEDDVSGSPIEERELEAAAPAFAGFGRADQNPFHGSWASDEGPQLFPYSEPVPYRYRMYIGAAVAILVGALVYMAWRGTSAGIGSSHSLPPAAPAASTEPPAPAQVSPTPKSTAPETSSAPAPSANEASPASRAAAPSTTSNTTSNKSPDANPSSNTAEPVKATAAPVPTSQPARGNGFEELTIAENYLNGKQGKARDSAEAAKWLWRSVSKQNASAAVLLSDLYLHGNGVAKSCDQARLLLDAAARKGAAGAAERLRNLPAYGCQ